MSTRSGWELPPPPRPPKAAVAITSVFFTLSGAGVMLTSYLHVGLWLLHGWGVIDYHAPLLEIYHTHEFVLAMTLSVLLVVLGMTMKEMSTKRGRVSVPSEYVPDDPCWRESDK